LEWTNQLAMLDTQKLKPLMDDLEQLKAEGLTGAAVAISFCRRLIQPLQDRAHLTFEYWGQSDLTQVAQRNVSKVEMCHTRFSVENRMHLICVPGSQFHTYDRLMSVISQDTAQKRTEKIY
jgi:hypothetical protein